jgi:cellulose synthase/poly-beta-1,6-N-acetylglucosamine synthase-like glycosyltransferase
MLETILFYVALFTALLSAAVWTSMFTGVIYIRRLRDIEPPDEFAWPKVSVIIPARNEEREIEEALQSVLRLDYPDYEVLVINDRSTDRTPEILSRMHERYPQLSSATVEELPRGWLGKNHALHFGAATAQGELLLFTDADIVFQPDVLRRAVFYLEREQIDHLAMTPDVRMPNGLLASFVVVFTMLFTIFTKPWRVRNPKSPAHIGIGAFNLIRTSSYRAMGGHGPIALRPDDDLKLGKLVKKNGFTQDVVNASGFLLVRWYASLAELIRGLEKNAFSGVDYSIVMTVYSSILMLIVNVWPFVAIWFTRGPTQWLNGLVIAMHFTSYLCTAWEMGVRWWTVFFYPIDFLMFVYIQWRTMLLNHWMGGIRWRDTLYPLAELKANRV